VEAIVGKTVAELSDMTAVGMLQLFGPRLTTNRQKCCLLSWQVLQQALHSPLKLVD
jgi:nitrogen fixation NifU-like protein